jgi:hypothetical protein
MRRMTRRVGLFGGPAAVMPAMGVKKPAERPLTLPTKAAAAPQDGAAGSPEAPEKTPWYRRFFGK